MANDFGTLTVGGIGWEFLGVDFRTGLGGGSLFPGGGTFEFWGGYLEHPTNHLGMAFRGYLLPR